ncbi:hypothetical protein ACFQZJ_18130 [Maribacter chungangensis]|uniref:Uncharacterized protein n=1 Tax=Maribacter chungangensis TaxID=1069117 RepID=A0ABW3B937_9FLAO
MKSENTIDSSNNAELIFECAKEIVAVAIEYIGEIEFEDFNSELNIAIGKAQDFIKRTEWYCGLKNENQLKAMKIFEESMKTLLDENLDSE